MDINLLLATEEEAGKITYYAYKEGTNLLSAEYVGDSTQQIHRMFRNYNDQGVCIETIVDNGTGKESGDLTGVTMRRITRTQVRQEGVAIGVPLVEEEFFLDTAGNLQPLQRTENEYDANGRIIKKSLFGADGKLAQTFTWIYDKAGQVIKTTGPSGTVAYAYDANGNKVREHFIDRGLIHHNTYDRLNHLIKRCEVDQSGQNPQERVWRYRYNMLGQCVEEIDPLDHSITHHFDDFGREIETVYPSGCTPGGKSVPVKVRYAYDLCDMKVETTNALGHSEKTSYNMRGQITRLEVPDGSYETSEYTLGGALKRTVSRLGLITEYDNDFMGRAIAKREYDNQGKLLSQIRYVYYGFLLHSMAHENGPTIVYRYDGAGRLIEQENNQERELSYTYDAMGLLHTKTEWINGSLESSGAAAAAKVTTYAYDALGNRILEQSRTYRATCFPSAAPPMTSAVIA